MSLLPHSINDTCINGTAWQLLKLPSGYRNIAIYISPSRTQIATSPSGTIVKTRPSEPFAWRRTEAENRCRFSFRFYAPDLCQRKHEIESLIKPSNSKDSSIYIL